MFPLQGNQGNPPTSPIALDFRGVANPVGRELHDYDKKIQGKIDLSRRLDDHLKGEVKAMEMGYLDQWKNERDRMKRDLAAAEAAEKDARVKAKPIIDKFFTESFGEDDANTNAYTQRNSSGTLVPDEGRIMQAATDFVKRNGVSGNVATSLYSEMMMRVKAGIVRKDAESTATKELQKLIKSGQAKFPTAENTKVAGEMILANSKLQIDAVSKITQAKADGFIKRKQAEMKPVVDAVFEKYNSLQNQVRDQLVADETANAQFAIDQYKSDLEGAVNRGEIMQQSAQFRMNNFLKDTYERLNQSLASDEFKSRVRSAFEQQYSQDFQQEFDALNQAYRAEVKAKLDEYNKRGSRAVREISNIAKDALSKLEERGWSKEGIEQYQKIYENAYNKAFKKYDEQAVAEVEGQFAKAAAALGVGLTSTGSNLSSVAMDGFKKFFGEGFMMNLGNLMRSKAMYMESEGFGGPLVDWFKVKGSELFSDNFNYTPEFKSWNFLSPAFYGAAGSQIVYSLPAMTAGAILAATGVGAPVAAGLFAVAQTADNAAINSGDGYLQVLQNDPTNFVGAKKAARDIFALHMLDLPLNMLIGRMWFGKGPLSQRVGQAVTGLGSEYATETYESATQKSVVNPLSGNLLKDSLTYFADPATQQEGIMAMVGSAMTLGMGSVASKMNSMFAGKANPGAQYVAQLMYDRSPSYARAIFAGAEQEYGAQGVNEIMATIDRVETAVTDARALGLPRPQALAYVEMTERLAVEKAKLDVVSTPAAKTYQESKIKQIEQEIGKIVEGTTQPVLISIPGTDVAVTDKDAEAIMQDPDVKLAIAEGTISVTSQDEKVMEKVEAVKEETLKAVADAQQVIESPQGNIAITENQQANEEASADLRQGQEEGQKDVLNTPATGSEAADTTSDPVVPEDANAEARKAVLQKFDADMSILTKGSVPGSKTVSSMSVEGKKKKLDAMTRRLIDAKNEGVISESEFSDMYDAVSREYQKVGGAIAVPKAEEKTKATPAFSKTNSKITVGYGDVDTLDESKFTGVQKKIVGDVKRVVKAVSKLVKQTTGQNLTVNLHRNEKSYGEAVVAAGGSQQDSDSKGFYMDTDGNIHINMASATSETVLHEGFHPVLDHVEKTAPERIDKLYNQLGTFKEGRAFIASNKRRYSGATTQKKEAITDFIAHVADGKILVDATNFQRVKNFVLGLLKRMGFDVNTKTIVNMKDAADLQALAKSITEKFRAGQEVEAEAVAESGSGMAQFSKGELSLRNLFQKVYTKEGSTVRAIQEVQKAATKYFKGKAKTMDADLIGEVMDKINALAKADITYEDIDAAMSAIDDAITLQANRDAIMAESANDRSFAQSLIDMALAVENTAEAIKAIQREVVKYFKDNGLDMSKRNITNIMKQLTRLAEAGDSAQTLWDVISNIDTAIAEQRRADEIAKVKEVQKKFKKFLKSAKFLTSDYRTKLNTILSMMPSPTLMAAVGANMGEYMDALNAIMAEYGNRQGVRDLTMTNLDYMRQKMEAITKDIADYLDAKMIMRYNAERKAAKSEAFPTYDEWLQNRQDLADLDKLEAATDRSANKGKAHEALLALVKLQQERLKEFLQESGDVMSDKMKTIAQRVSAIDVSLLREQEARHVISIVNNIVNDGNFQSAERLLAFYDAQVVNQEIKDKPIRIRGTWAPSARAFGNLLQSITFNRSDAARIRNLFLDVMSAANRVQRMMYGFSKADGKGVIDEVYQIARRMGKDKPLANYRVGIFQFLNQAAAQPEPETVTPNTRLLEQGGGLQEFMEQRKQQTGITKQQDFENRLNNLIDGTVIGLFNYASANEGSGGITVKAMKDQAIKVADSLQQFGLIAGYKIVTDSKGNQTMEVQRKDDVSLDGLYEMLDRNEKELYDYIRDKFADPEYLEDMKLVSEGLHGLPFNAIENYAPQIAHSYKSADALGASKQIDAIGNMNFRGDGNRKIGVRPSDRFLQRSRLANPDEHYYSMDAIGNFLTAYYESNLAIEGGAALKKLSYVLNGKTFEELMNGVFNKAIDGVDRKYEKTRNNSSQYTVLLERFAEILRDSARPPFLTMDQRAAWEKAFQYTLSGITSTYLQTSDQVLKQLLPNLAAGATAIGLPETMQATRIFLNYTMGGTAEEREQFREFMRNFEADFRSPMGEAAFDELNKLLNDYDTVYLTAMKLTSFKDQYTPARIGKWIFKNSDRVAYAINAISAYIEAEVKAGRLNSPWEFGIENMTQADRGSVADALNMAEMLNNASKAAERAPYTRLKQTDADIKDSIFRNLMFLKGFSLNSFMSFQNNMRIALDPGGRATSEEKWQAGRRALSYVTQIAVFNMIKVYLISTGFNILGDVLISKFWGIDIKDEPEDEKRKRLAKRASQFWHSSAADAMVGFMPAPAEWLIKSKYNALYDVMKKPRFEAFKRDPESAVELFGRTIPPSLDYDSKAAKAILKGTTLEAKHNPFFLGNTGGMGSVEVYEDLFKSFEEALKTRGSREYSEETNARLDKMDVAKLMAFLTGQGDALKVMYGMERQLKFQDKLSNSKSKGSGSPIKSLQRQFKSNAIKGLKIKPPGL